MMLSYIKLALRLLVRNPFHAVINFVGLAIGFSVFFVLWQYSDAEINSERFFPDHDKIVRYGIVWNQLNSSDHWDSDRLGTAHPGVGLQAAEDFAGIEACTRVFFQQNFTRSGMGHGSEFPMAFSSVGGTKTILRGEHMAYADANFFAFFGLSFVSGAADEALKAPGSVAISSAFARRHFGDENPIGKTIWINDTIAFEVRGVFQDIPRNTHLQLDLVASVASIQSRITAPYFTSDPHVYFRLSDGVRVEDLRAQLSAVDQEYWEPVVKASGFNPARVKLHSHVQRLTDIPFEQLPGDAHFQRSIPTLIFLRIAGIAVLLMACVNYVNLSLVAQGRRMKELVTRKTSGAMAGDILFQFLIESLLLHVVAGFAAITLIQLFRVPLARYMEFFVPAWRDVSLHTGLVLSGVVIGGSVVTAVYPTLITLARAPRVVASSFKLRSTGGGFSSLLIICQYTAGLVLTVYAFSIWRQLDFILADTMGIEATEVMVTDIPGGFRHDEVDAFIGTARKIAGPRCMATSSNVTGDDNWSTIVFRKEGDERNFLAQSTGGVDENFLPFYNIQLLAGRNFASDERGPTVLVSEEMTAFLGFSSHREVVGQRIQVWTGFGDEMKEAEIIGVIRSFQSDDFLRHERDASANTKGTSRIILTYKNQLVEGLRTAKLSLRIPHRQLGPVLKQLGKAFQVYFPGNIFNWYFLDEHIDRHYSWEKVVRNQAIVFTILAIVIACLGVLGMVSHIIIRKQKEIGIRKVLGARLLHLGVILLRPTLLQMATGFVIGLPLAMIPIHQYLEKFDKQLHFSWWHYIIPALGMAGIVFGTVASLVVNAAKANAVESLRYE